jgi:hypothetical protein
MRGLARATSDSIRFDYGRMAQQVQDARKDGVMIDFSRLICAHFGKMVEYWSSREGRPVSAHNNKTLFLEAIDIWCRARFCDQSGRVSMNGASLGRASGTWTSSPKDVLEHAMKPFYGAMALDDPSRYRMGRQPMPPSYVGTHEDAIATALGLCACLEVQPLQFRLGINDGVPEHIWGRAHADGKWYDVDLSRPEFKLGDHLSFQSYEEVEIPL